MKVRKVGPHDSRWADGLVASLVPGMRPRAPKRNLLVTILYALALLLAFVFVYVPR